MIGWKTLSSLALAGNGDTSYKGLSAGCGKITIRTTQDMYIEFSNDSSTVVSGFNSMIIPANTTTTLEVPTLRYTTTGSALGGNAKIIYFLAGVTGTAAGAVRIVEH